jgi:hypothetical protein
MMLSRGDVSSPVLVKGLFLLSQVVAWMYRFVVATRYPRSGQIPCRAGRPARLSRNRQPRPGHRTRDAMEAGHAEASSGRWAVTPAVAVSPVLRVSTLHEFGSATSWR